MSENIRVLFPVLFTPSGRIRKGRQIVIEFDGNTMIIQRGIAVEVPVRLIDACKSVGLECFVSSMPAKHIEGNNVLY